jgi:hypothetical protein
LEWDDRISGIDVLTDFWGPNEELRDNMVLPPFRWRQAKLHRSFTYQFSSLLIRKEKSQKSNNSFGFSGKGFIY